MTTRMYHLLDEHLESRLAPDEVMVLHRKSGEYLGLEGVGDLVWRRLAAGPQRLEDLVAAVCAEYEVDPESCRRDLVTFLDELESSGLVEQRD